MFLLCLCVFVSLCENYSVALPFQPATDAMTRFDFEELWFFAALIHCMRAARGKGAALWDFKRIGDCAFNGY